MVLRIPGDPFCRQEPSPGPPIGANFAYQPHLSVTNQPAAGIEIPA